MKSRNFVTNLQKSPWNNDIIFRRQLIRTILMDFSIQELSPSKIYQSLTHPADHDFLCRIWLGKLFIVLVDCISFEKVLNDLQSNVILFEFMWFRTPTGHLEHSLGLFRGPSLFLEEFRVQVCTVVTKMMAARCKDITLTIGFQQSSYRNVKCLSAHMLTNPDHWRFREFLFYLLGVLNLALVFGIFSHGFGEKTEVKIADVGAVPLEIRILLEKSIELVSSDLSFQKNIFWVIICELLYFIGNCIG